MCHPYRKRVHYGKKEGWCQKPAREAEDAKCGEESGDLPPPVHPGQCLMLRAGKVYRSRYGLLECSLRRSINSELFGNVFTIVTDDDALGIQYT